MCFANTLKDAVRITSIYSSVTSRVVQELHNKHYKIEKFNTDVCCSSDVELEAAEANGRLQNKCKCIMT